MIKSIGNHLLLVFLLTIVANADQNGKPNEKESLASMPKSFSPISNQDSKINLKNNDEQIMGKNGLNLKRSIPLLNIEPRQPNDELSELEKAKLFCQQLAFANQLNIDYDRNSGIRFKKSPFEAEGIRFKKTPFEAEGIRYRKSSPFNDEGIRFKKSPFDEEGIRYKKSLPFNDEGIRFKKSPFEAEGIRYKKSPFDEEGIRYKKSPFDEEGIRY